MPLISSSMTDATPNLQSGPNKGRTRARKLMVVAAVAVLHLAAITGLIRAFDIDIVPEAVRTITAFAVPGVTPEPSPEPTIEERVEEVEPQGASGEEAEKAKPRDKAVPPVRVPVAKPSPAPPAASDGQENKSGAGESGDGTGGGGPGFGTGSGGQGDGSGGIAYQRRAQKIAGDIRAKDYPRVSADQRDGSYVIVHFTVGPDGRARACRVARSSGVPEVDAITCRLVEQRFRYEPAIDGNGNPTSEKVGWKQWWWQ